MTDSRQLPARERHPVLFGFLLALGIVALPILFLIVFPPNPSYRAKVSVRNASSTQVKLIVIGEPGPYSKMKFPSARSGEYGVVLKPGESKLVATADSEAMELTRGSIVVLAVLDPDRLTVVSSVVIDIGVALNSVTDGVLPYVFDGREFVLDAVRDR